MTPEQKEWIDAATYEELRGKWRFTKIGESDYFKGKCFDYYKKAMIEKRAAIAEEIRKKVSEKFKMEE